MSCFIPKGCLDIWILSISFPSGQVLSMYVCSYIYLTVCREGAGGPSGCTRSIWPPGLKGCTPWWPQWFCQCSPGVCSWFPPVCEQPPSTRREKQKVRGHATHKTSVNWNDKMLCNLFCFLKMHLSTRDRADLSCQGVGERSRHQILGSLDAQVDYLTI